MIFICLFGYKVKHNIDKYSEKNVNKSKNMDFSVIKWFTCH